MSGLDYETVARFAQQAGTIYFAVLFVVAAFFALRPRRAQEFKRLAALPLEDNEDDHVQP